MPAPRKNQRGAGTRGRTPPGKVGMHGGRGGVPRKKRRGGNLQERAAGDVGVSVQPYLDELERQRVEGGVETAEQNRATQALYDALNRQLGELNAGYGPQSQAITDQLQTDLGEWGAQLGSVSPAGELAAAGGLFGSMGAGSLSELASQQARNLAYGTSAERQGGIENMTTQRNALQDLAQQNDELDLARRQAMQAQGPEILSQLGDLRDFRAQMGLANREFRLRKGATNAQRDFLLRQADFYNNRPNNRPNPNPNNDKPKPNPKPKPKPKPPYRFKPLP